MNDYNFGNFVCMLRENKGLTQAEIAEMLGVTAAAVSKWENGSSKPRVEVLFKLAEILGVRPKEMMAGHYIEGSELDPEAIKNINERYEYLRRIDSHNTTNVKVRRLAAALCDWLITGIFVLLVLTVLFYILYEEITNNNPIAALLMLPIIISYPVLFILRDVVFGKRSIGKRILGLIVIDRKTGDVAKPSQRAIRNIFFPLKEIDAIVMLFSGSSIGDRIANAAVVPIKELYYPEDDESDVEKINNYKAPSPMNTKAIIILVCGILAAFIIFLACIAAVTLTALNSSMDTVEYQLAHTYLIESDTFKEYGLDEDDIRLNSYSKNITTNEDGRQTTTVELGFRIGATRSIYVICHDDGEGWYVCEECTKFE